MLVPIDQLVAHPLNSNLQSPQIREKLKFHIKSTGMYPGVIVRDLTASVDYGHLAPKLQILDGVNRCAILRELGHAQVKVEHWGPLSDQQAEILLATLNPLRGKDDPTRRATLLDVLKRRFNDDLGQVSRFVPETVRELQVRTQAITTGPAARRVIDTADDEQGERFDTFYCLMDDDMRKVVDAALRLRRGQGDLPGAPMSSDTGQNLRQDYDRGRALSDICAQWFLTQT